MLASTNPRSNGEVTIALYWSFISVERIWDRVGAVHGLNDDRLLRTGNDGQRRTAWKYTLAVWNLNGNRLPAETRAVTDNDGAEAV